MALTLLFAGPSSADSVSPTAVEWSDGVQLLWSDDVSVLWFA